ncbi:MAG: dienelactone hydrolase family protein [Kiloniellales bacterium]|nr:dienelactone hydrolase family protein [Kiloniellales bacterium]
MAHVVLFHSILGLRPAEQEIAAALVQDGHRVALPDLYDGRATDDYDAGFRLKEEIGDAVIDAHARSAIEEAPNDAVLSGVSLGAFLVGRFWGQRPRMPGALLFAGVAPWMTPRRPGLPVSAHIARPDPFDDEAFFAEWRADAGEAALEMHRYDGVGHYFFLDRSLPDYDAAAAELCLERARAFLRSLAP